ncbi:acyltransferase domain-containing protein [Streptomyces sp. NPDC058755]|uniref:acyltransferase domain-containing protein n=1 Tax=Streptomyces sp. NPDC058755 TaxID=3346624 RepID=UPI00367758B7
MSRGEVIADCIRSELARLLDVDPRSIGDADRFAQLGLDSLRAATLIHALSDELGRRLSPVLLWRYPTVSALSECLASGADLALPEPVGSTERDRSSAVVNEPIAVVGLACRLPSAPDAAAFWQLLESGGDAIRDVPSGRWNVDAPPDPRLAPVAAAISGRAGFLEHPVDGFDPLFFGISPREAREMDPNQRLFLEVAWEALEDAGLANEALEGSRTGVFAGAIWHDYADLAEEGREPLSFYSGTGRALNMVANRLSYVLGLRGPSVLVDSACSASLLAVHLACQSLWAGESTTALAGGVNLMLSPTTTAALANMGGLSPDARCKAFDAAADGIARGEGCGVVVLKPLSRALADGDRIRCTIRGSAANNDGSSNGLTAPSPLAQEEVLRAAYARARVSPADVHFVEAHGTGTSLGDPIEAAALGAVFSPGRPTDSPLRIGSVKTNMGHLEAAAGVTGLIKAILSLQHRALPANLHFHTPNPHIAFEGWGLRVPTALEPWPQDRPLLAGVNSFGWGGTNVHMVLEGWQEPAMPALRPPGSHAPVGPDGRAQSGEPVGLPARASTGTSVDPDARTAFVCSPHGHQWVGMGRNLFRTEPAFRAAVQRIDAEFAPMAGWSIADELFAVDAAERVHRVDVAQPVLFAVQLGLAAVLRARGVEPDAVAGACFGEISAAAIAGILDTSDAVRTVYHYSQAQQRLAGQGGGMAVVELPAAELSEFVTEQVVVAAEYGPRSTGLSGEASALEGVLARLKERGVLCGMVRIDVAVHSAAVEPVTADFAAATAGISPRPGRVPMTSALTGAVVPWHEMDAAYFARSLRAPMRLLDATRALLAEGIGVLLELSAHPVLGSALRQTVADLGSDAVVLGSMCRGEDDRVGVLDTLAALDRPGRGRQLRPELVTLSAKSPSALRELAGRVADAAEAGTTDVEPRDLAGALARRAGQPHRFAAVATTMDELVQGLRAFADGADPEGAVSGRAAEAREKLAFICSGHGSQWLGMGTELLRSEPEFESAVRTCDAAIRPHTGWSVLAELTAGPEESHLNRVDVVQPVVFTVQVALAALWRSWGIEPDAIVGHSMGEVAAAHIAGALSLDDAARIICHRSRLLQRATGQGGAMLVAELDLEQAAQVLTGHEQAVSVAVSNSPQSTVLSGDRAVLTRIGQLLDADDVFWRWIKAADAAGHSPQMDPLCAELQPLLEGITPRAARVPVYSTVTGELLDGTELTERYWARNLREPVLFSRQLMRMMTDGVRTFVELSPHPVLLPSVQQTAEYAGTDVTTLASLRRDHPERAALLSSLGSLYVRGRTPSMRQVLTPGRHMTLPSYPWQRERYWLGRSDDGVPRPRTNAGALLGERIDSAIEPGTHYWQMDFDENTAAATDYRVARTPVLPGAAIAEMALSAAAQTAPEVRFTVTNLRFLRPLALSGDAWRRVQAVIVSGQQHVFRVFEQRGTDMDEFASAVLVPGRPEEPSAPLSAEQIGARLPDAVSGADYYRDLAARGLAYGPAYRGIERTAVSDREALVRFDLTAAHGAVPGARPSLALLEVALQAAVAPALHGQQDAGKPPTAVVTGISELDWWRAPVTVGWVHAVVASLPGDPDQLRAELRVFGDDGAVVLTATGVLLTRGAQLPEPATAVADGQEPAQEDGAVPVRDLLSGLHQAAERRAVLQSVLCEQVARIVKLAAARIEPERPLRELGFDSVMALELRNALQSTFGMRLPATVFWNYPTIIDLTAFLAQKLGIDTEGAAPGELVGTPGSTVDSPPIGGDGESAETLTEEELLERETAELMSRVDAI